MDVTMRGSEKQVAWARDIIAGIVAQNKRAIAAYEAAVERNELRPEDVAPIIANITATNHLLETIDDATWVIDHRGDIANAMSYMHITATLTDYREIANLRAHIAASYRTA